MLVQEAKIVTVVGFYGTIIEHHCQSSSNIADTSAHHAQCGYLLCKLQQDAESRPGRGPRTLTPRNPRSAFRRQIEDLVSLNDFLIVSNGSKTCEGWPRRPGP